MPTESDGFGGFGVEFDYDAEDFLRIVTTIVAEYPDAPLSEVWRRIDWDSVRLYGETRGSYQERCENRGVFLG